MEKEKGFREIKCEGEGCPLVLKFKITEKNYGQTGKVVCKSCGQSHRVTIPFPPLAERESTVKLPKEPDFWKDIFPWPEVKK